MIPAQFRRGFTLIELLVVLLILTAVTTVALRSTAKLEDRSRLDRTQQILKEIERATVGSLEEQLHGPPVSCYLSDTGEMPRSLSDLWVRPSAIAAAEVDPETHLAAGWNGPYLELPFGISDLVNAPILDGFGGSIELTIGPSTDSSLVDLDHWSIATTIPSGLVLDRVLLGDSIDRVHCEVPVRLELVDGAAPQMVSIEVNAFVPRNGSIIEVTRNAANVSSSDASLAFVTADGLTPGQRAFLATVSAGATTYESELVVAKLVPGVNPSIVLTCHPVGSPPLPSPSIAPESGPRSAHATRSH